MKNMKIGTAICVFNPFNFFTIDTIFFLASGFVICFIFKCLSRFNFYILLYFLYKEKHLYCFLSIFVI